VTLVAAPDPLTDHTILRAGSLTQLAIDVKKRIFTGALPMKNPHPTSEVYVHPTKRPSADRRPNAPIKALWDWLDLSDYLVFGDTQETADEGVLHPASPYYGCSFVNYQ
jgi:hypothetical protein